MTWTSYQHCSKLVASHRSFLNCCFRQRRIWWFWQSKKAELLHEYFQSPQIDGIFNVSGGDAANLVLPHIDWEIPTQNPKPFFAISDNSVLLNAICTKTGIPTYHYSLRTLLDVGNPEVYLESFSNLPISQISIGLTPLKLGKLKGAIVGGNVRCFSKLAGTEHLPPLKGKTMFLESLGGDRHRIASYFQQVSMLPGFHEISGILFGTFTQLQSEVSRPEFLRFLNTLVKDLEIPVAQSDEIGHGSDSVILPFGTEIEISNSTKTTNNGMPYNLKD